jgi:hypothetical protein
MGRWVPPVLYAAVIFYLSGQPHIRLGISDKIAHAAEYFLFAWLVIPAIRDTAPVTAARYAIAVGIVTSVLYGVTDEFHQGFVPGRDASGYDLLADAIGACLAGAARQLRARAAMSCDQGLRRPHRGDAVSTRFTTRAGVQQAMEKSVVVTLR